MITAVLTFGALGVTAKMTHMHYQKHHGQYMQGDNAQGQCFMWDSNCGTEEATSPEVE